MFRASAPLQRSCFLLILWLIVFPVSSVLSQGLAYLPLAAGHAVLLRSGLLTAILILAMDLVVVPVLQQLMSWLFTTEAHRG
jgi:antibiotic biosynthesis monooxygenase (ABM) superfamily enzyme